MNIAHQVASARRRQVVLVADDEEAILDLTDCVISELGLMTLKANDGMVALEFASNCQQFLVCAILDIQMPIMNGVEAAHAIQLAAPDLALVLMSDGIPAALVQRVRQLRAFTMLYKPFTLATLRALLVELVP